MMKVLIVNGPNLNLLGKREELIYGKDTLEKIEQELKELFPKMDLVFFQSNHEGAIVDELQLAADPNGYHAVIINAGAFTHYSIAILDALRLLKLPKVEVHLSNVYARESYRQKSVIAEACDGVIAGFGKQSYRLALEWLAMNERGKIGFQNR